jgi:flagellar motor switch protein FliM
VSAAQPVSLLRETDKSVSFPQLDRVTERMARALGEIVGGIAGACSVACEPLHVTTAGAWRSAQSHIVSARYRMTPLVGWMALVVPQRFVAQAVDLYYGGSGAPGAGRATLSAAEARVFARMAEALGTMLPPCWADCIALVPELIAAETGAARPALGKDDMEIAVQRFTANFAGSAHGIDAIYPLAMLRAMPQISSDSEDDATAPAADADWQAALTGAVMQVQLPLRTIFARPELPLSRLLNLRPGDILPVHLPTHVPVTVGGRHFAQASVGEANGRTAIKIEKMEGLNR